MPSSTDAVAAAGPRPFSFSGTNSASYLNEQPQLQRPSQEQQQQQRPHTSRFVEGSMNDRTSRAPPVSYLGGMGAGNSRSRSRSRDNSVDINRDDPHAHREYHDSTRRSLQMARPSLSMFRTSNTNASSGTSASITSTNTTSTTATTATDATATSNTSSLRRPRSFLGPIWDGMTKRLHRRTRSTVEADVAKKREQERLEQQRQREREQQQLKPQPAMGQSYVTLPGTDWPSPDEVFANYQQLMQSGFFNKRAIPATREGLASRGGPSAPPPAPATVTACPDRPPPPPPKSASWMNGTPLSPVAPSPAAASASTTPRGTKRTRASADDGEDVAKGSLDDTISKAARGSTRARTDAAAASPTRTSPRKTSKKLRKATSIRSTPGLDGSVRSLRSMHKASAAAAAAAEAEYNNEAANGRPSTAYSQAGSMVSSSRSTRSNTAHSPVEVHQPLPPLPTSVTSAPMPLISSKRIVSKKRKETSRNASLDMDRDGQDTAAVNTVAATLADHRTSSSEEPRRKKRSQGPAAIVHQASNHSGPEDAMMLDNAPSKEAEAKESQDDALRPPSMTHYHRPLGPHNPATPGRGSNTGNKASGRAVLTTISPASAQQQQLERQQERQQAPISFHYPQRVRVRRPVQAQVVEVKATTISSSKPSDNGKSLLFREVDAENETPMWQD
ncbi:hypothetical protein SCUCBS95973_000380 [Sporothrix curviconia]|uniref:Uncharacterized protein n=1 Tax=Sporothrix curviconia TaxID=1260050 RepID=A0ABP0APT3_9PEZI